MNAKEQIMTHVLQCSRTELFSGTRTLTRDLQQKFDELFTRYQSGEPLQYILGSTSFYGYDITVNPSVLIPRPETELLVELVLNQIPQHSTLPLNILNIGTGSGCIEVALLKERANVICSSIDCSMEALLVAQKNLYRHDVCDRADLYCRDICYLMPIYSPTYGYDFIISNPPYISTDQLCTLPQDVQAEPVLALDGGESGLDFYKLYAEHIHRWMVSSGKLFLEIGDGQSEEITKLFMQQGSYSSVKTKEDYSKVVRYLEITK